MSRGNVSGIPNLGEPSEAPTNRKLSIISFVITSFASNGNAFKHPLEYLTGQ